MAKGNPGSGATSTSQSVTGGRMVQDLGTTGASESTAASTVDNLLRVASVQRVDPKRMTVDVITLTGKMIPYPNVPLTFGSAGARNFCGVIPDVNDNCILGFAPKESGRTTTPYIVGWVVPGTYAGYDWVPSQPASPLEQPGDRAAMDRMEGTFTRRRHKLHNFAPGNACMSSSQGADLILDESATLVNRRGNEIVLRDQDQALVIRTLQQFHAGAGFRIYGGMVQRDGATLPTQMLSDGINWASMGQVDSEGEPVGPRALGDTPDSYPGWLTPADIFARDADRLDDFPGNSVGAPELVDGRLDPFDLLQRGLFVDMEGEAYDGRTAPTAVYGGKAIYRIASDTHDTSLNSVLGDVPTFTEYRIEVAHTSDGTLPVTEQTDGIDIDRLPESPPVNGNALNVSDNTPFVELVMGTVVGNDPLGAREQYGMPLKAEIFKDGAFAPKVTKVTSAVGSDLTDQMAFMIRVWNPADPAATPAFWGITKGGALKSYFPGHGSQTAQEHYQTGKKIHLGVGPDNTSFAVEAEGAISFRNESLGTPSSGIGFEANAVNAGLKLYGGAAIIPDGNSAPPADADAATAASAEPRASVLIKGAVDGVFEFPEGRAFFRAPEIIMDNAATIRQVASSNIDIASGDKFGVSAGTGAFQFTQGMKTTVSGPKGGPTGGPLVETSLTGTPLTGCIGGKVDEYSVIMGGRQETYTLGKSGTQCKVGGISLEAMNPSPVDVVLGPGASAELSAGPMFGNNSVTAGLLGASVVTGIPLAPVSMKASAGSASIIGGLGIKMKGSRLSAKAAYYSFSSFPTGGIMNDGCLDPLTGSQWRMGGGFGCPAFRVS